MLEQISIRDFAPIVFNEIVPGVFFRVPHIFQVSHDGLYFTSSKSTLGIIGYGVTRDALATNLKENLEVLWRNYALIPDNELTVVGLVAKKKILELADTPDVKPNNQNR